MIGRLDTTSVTPNFWYEKQRFGITVWKCDFLTDSGFTSGKFFLINVQMWCQPRRMTEAAFDLWRKQATADYRAHRATKPVAVRGLGTAAFAQIVGKPGNGTYEIDAKTPRAAMSVSSFYNNQGEFPVREHPAQREAMAVAREATRFRCHL